MGGVTTMSEAAAAAAVATEVGATVFILAALLAVTGVVSIGAVAAAVLSGRTATGVLPTDKPAVLE